MWAIARFSLSGQVPAGQVDVAQRRLGRAVPGEGRDRVQLPAHPGQVGQAQVPGGVRGEPRHLGGQRDPAHHLRPGPQASAARPWLRRDSDRNSGPRARLSVARCARYSASSTPVAAEYGTTRSRRVFVVSARTRSIRCAGIQVVGAQRAQLLPPQRRVVGQREHHPVADRLAGGTPSSTSQPLLLGRDPRQLDQPRHQRRAAPPPNRRPGV